MGVFSGPDVSESGLLIALDVASQKCISPLGCTGFNNAPQLVKNLVSTSDTINSYNGLKLGNLTYYTVFAIDYPENSYGGDAAGRNGMTQGYNVRSGAKTYDSSRALHLWVWNNDTNSWIADSYFRGFRLSGHCYDYFTYAENGYTTELQYFAEDFNTIKNTFPNCTYIVVGSHRADRYNSTVRNILTDLGKPNGYIDSDYIAAPEWILVGKPGLGAGNYYGWAYENYSTDPTSVAHLNFGLPIYGTKDNYLEFDGTDDYISFSSNPSLTNQITIEVWVNLNSTPNGNGWICGREGSYRMIYTSSSFIWVCATVNNGWYTAGTAVSASSSATSGTYQVVGTYDGSNNKIYVNGILISTGSGISGNILSTGSYYLFRSDAGGLDYGKGRLFTHRLYNRALTATEIQQNFNASRGRFGV